MLKPLPSPLLCTCASFHRSLGFLQLLCSVRWPYTEMYLSLAMPGLSLSCLVFSLAV